VSAPTRRHGFDKPARRQGEPRWLEQIEFNLLTGSSRIIYDDLRAAGFRFIDHRPLVADTQNVAKYVARNPRGQNKGGKSE
jgi:hypothetical protein